MLFDKLLNQITNKEIFILFYIQQFSSVALVLPFSMLAYFIGSLFFVGYLLFLLRVDDIAIIPFQTTHKIYFIQTLIPLYIAYTRVQMTSKIFMFTNYNIYFLILYFLISIIFGLFLSRNKTLSYFGSIERGMGVDFYIQVFSFIPLGVFLIGSLGKVYLISLLLVSQMFEVIFIEMQSEQLNKIHDFHFNHLLKMGDRYVGTLSNPIHTSQYLTTLLPITLFIVLLHTSFLPLSIVLFSQFVLIISYGIWKTAGRQSSLTYLIDLAFMSIMLFITFNFYQVLFIAYFVVLYYVYLRYFGTNNYQRLKQVFKKDKFDLDKVSSQSSGNEKWVQHLAKNDRKILWKIALLLPLKKYLFSGQGNSNIPNAYNSSHKRELSLYYPDKTIDSSHNFYIDSILTLGFIPQILSILSLVQIFVMLILQQQYILAISMFVFQAEFFFSFPLQANLLELVMIILLGTSAIVIQASWPLLIIFGIFVFIMFINIFFAVKENKMLQLVQLGLSANNSKSSITLDLFNAAIQESPWDTRPLIYIRPVILGELPRIGKITLEDLVNLRDMLEINSKKIIHNQENKQQILYLFQYLNLTIAMTIHGMNAKNKNNMNQGIINNYVNSQISYLNKQLIENPYSIDTRLLYSYLLIFINGDGKFNNILPKFEDKLAYDICTTYGVSGEFFGFVEVFLNKYNQVKTERYDEIEKIFKDRLDKK